MRSTLIVALCLSACGTNGGDNGGVTPPPAGQGTVSGSVVTDAQQGIPGVSVQLSRAGATSRNTTTSTTGTFSFGAVDAGTWTVAAALPAGFEAITPLSTTVQVTAGQTASTPAIVMRQQGPPSGPPLTITIGDNFFNPTPVTVVVGRTVRWVNSSSQLHNTTHSTWASPNLSTGGSFEHTFGTAGVFDYECTLHAGMNGRVVVQ